MPATKAKTRAARVLPGLRCLRRGRGCLQPMFSRACGACDDDRDACNPRRHACNPCFAVPAVPVATTRMLATHVFPCLHRLRVAVGASGAEAALFISSRFKKRKMIPASWPDLRRLWAPLESNCSFFNKDFIKISPNPASWPDLRWLWEPLEPKLLRF